MGAATEFLRRDRTALNMQGSGPYSDYPPLICTWFERGFGPDDDEQEREEWDRKLAALPGKLTDRKVELAQCLLKQPDLDPDGYHGLSYLYWAFRLDAEPAFRTMLEKAGYALSREEEFRLALWRLDARKLDELLQSDASLARLPARGHDEAPLTECFRQDEATSDDAILACAYLLLLAGADPNPRDELFGNTPLHQCCYRPLAHVFAHLLVGFGALPDARNNAGQTPGDIASSRRHLHQSKFRGFWSPERFPRLLVTRTLVQIVQRVRESELPLFGLSGVFCWHFWHPSVRMVVSLWDSG